ncbi:hypothetical protein [Amphritea japonica]|nr:hypothetical protein [Amphritea japonica]
MDKVYPATILLATMITAVAGSASERPPRLPSSTYNVEIRPDNYYYHEQQVADWFIQCFQRKQPSERYWHCNASDSETIKRFRTTLKDPALAFTAPESQQNNGVKKVPPRALAKQSATERPSLAEAQHKVTSQQNVIPTEAQSAEVKPATPVQIPIQVQLREPAAQLAYLEPKDDKAENADFKINQIPEVQLTSENADFSNPALEPETHYLLQLAAFQNKKSATRWQQKYPDIKTRVVRTQGKFTQWFNVITAQPIEYIDAIALSTDIKDQTGETPWIREKNELL